MMIARYIPVFEPKGSGGRDRGEEQFCLVCSGTGIRKAKGIGSCITVEEFPLKDIVCVDCFRKGKAARDTASGAAAGLLLGGAKGAIIGGLLFSGSSKPWWVEIKLKDKTVHRFRLYREIDSKTFLWWAERYKVRIKGR